MVAECGWWISKQYLTHPYGSKKSEVFHTVVTMQVMGTGIRDIPDHATFREKGVNTDLVRHTFFSLWPYVITGRPTLTTVTCNFQSTVLCAKCDYVQNYIDCSLFPNVN